MKLEWELELMKHFTYQEVVINIHLEYCVKLNTTLKDI